MALALVLGAVAVWWLFSGNGPQGPAGNASRYGAPDDLVTPSAPTVGPSASPTSGPRARDRVRIESYVVRDPLHVALNYRSATGCLLDTPRVLETDAAVTVTLVASPDGRQGACRRGVEGHTLLLRLDSPLDGRAILDGSTAPQVRVEQTADAYE
jgi:hypothetical protein